MWGVGYPVRKAVRGVITRGVGVMKGESKGDMCADMVRCACGVGYSVEYGVGGVGDVCFGGIECTIGLGVIDIEAVDT